MALSVDPLTFVISIPKADLSLIQTNPTEIRELDLNLFRLDLKAWEADGDGLAGGITFLKTHEHNTEVQLGGITYARVIEILSPYTITFEDGQYAVNLAGANSNVGDRINVNQVSVRSQNSAGLISSKAIEYSSFGGLILIDQVNGSLGTTFPAGTIQSPVKLTSDAKLIADFRGMKHIKFLGAGLLTTGDEFDDFIIEGISPTLSQITVDAAADVVNSEYRRATITGTLDGGSTIRECEITTINYVNGTIYDTTIGPGTITLGGAARALFINCSSAVPGTSTPIINGGGSGQTLALRNYSGGLKLVNKTGTDEWSIDLNSGQIILDSATVTGSGTIVVRGIGKLVDENGTPITTGVWNTTVNIINELVNPDTIAAEISGSVSPQDIQDIADAVWDENIGDHQTSGSTGKKLDDNLTEDGFVELKQGLD